MQQSTAHVLMVRPVRFCLNTQTLVSNAFQEEQLIDSSAQEHALQEFDQFVAILKGNHVDVTVVEDTFEPHKPDSIFPNNWIATQVNGNVYLFPMEAPNRRLERRMDVVNLLKSRFRVERVIDLSHYESKGKFLESTGSMVLDRQNKLAYTCLSTRSDLEVLNEFCSISGFTPITFEAYDGNSVFIYHTNVMMCIAERFAVICLEAIKEDRQRFIVSQSLVNTGKEIIEISLEQVNSFAGNMLEVRAINGSKLLVMSDQAYSALKSEQILSIEKYNKIVHAPLFTIESNGGGSARCMLAEIHLQKNTGAISNF